MTNTNLYQTTVKITRRRDLEPALDHPVSHAIQYAVTNQGKGILVTRHDHETFTIELSEEVTPGLIVERTAQ
jgi:hypothetical protein